MGLVGWVFFFKRNFFFFKYFKNGLVFVFFKLFVILEDVYYILGIYIMLFFLDWILSFYRLLISCCLLVVLFFCV